MQIFGSALRTEISVKLESGPCLLGFVGASLPGFPEAGGQVDAAGINFRQVFDPLIWFQVESILDLFSCFDNIVNFSHHIYNTRMDGMHENWESELEDTSGVTPGFCSLCGRYMQYRFQVRIGEFPIYKFYDIWVWCLHCDVSQPAKRALLAEGG